MKEEFLVLLLQELVIFPNQEIKIELLSDHSKNIINVANKNFNKKILVVLPKTEIETSPDVNDLPKIGVLSHIKSAITLSNGNVRLTLMGLKRLVINSYYYESDSDYLKASTIELKLPKFSQNEEKAVKRKLKNSLKKYIENNSLVSNSIISLIKQNDSISKLTDLIVVFLPFEKQKKQEYIEEFNPLIRGKNLIKDLEEEIEILKLEEEIEEDLKFKLIEKEKEFLLREKLDEIKKALGEESFGEDESKKYLNYFKALALNKKTFEKISFEIKKLKNIPKESSEYAVVVNYLDTLKALPWNEEDKEEIEAKKILNVLNSSHFGLTEIKERIEEYAEVKKIKGFSKTPTLCLVGPPGVGKTTIASSIAKALNREFIKISVAGLSDSSELIGNRKTYVGASYGKIIGALKKAKSNNPVILIDEVDKISKDYKKDPASIFLEVLDQNTNKDFVDNYIEVEFSLENVLFILTANNTSEISPPLLDRVEIFEINSYTEGEKFQIAKNHLIPKINKEYNSNISFTDTSIKKIIDLYTNESGVRNLDRVLNKITRKAIIRKIDKISINQIDLFDIKEVNEKINYSFSDSIGVVNFLALKNTGATISLLEARCVNSQEDLIVTGFLDQSLVESIKIAYTYLKDNFNVDFKEKSLHINFLEQSIKKEGPSAGVSIASAILSLFLKKSVPFNIAFSGELTLTGNILPVGGVKEKVLIAEKEGIKVLYLPYENQDSEKSFNHLIKNMEIKYIKNYNEIYKDLF